MSDFDNLEAAFADWLKRRPPKDVVPNDSDVAAAPPIPVGPATVVHYEITDNGITRTEEKVIVGRTITRKENNSHD